jgi:hypothetical protein
MTGWSRNSRLAAIAFGRIGLSGGQAPQRVAPRRRSTSMTFDVSTGRGLLGAWTQRLDQRSLDGALIVIRRRSAGSSFRGG